MKQWLLSLLAGFLPRASAPQPTVLAPTSDPTPAPVPQPAAESETAAPTAGAPAPAGKQPLGIRNNNPGNIRAVASIKWLGQIGVDPHGFVIFDMPINGIRALALCLRTYWTRYALRTVASIITRWAPPTENDTQAYIHAVCLAMGVGPTDGLLLEPDVLEGLTEAIIRHENGIRQSATLPYGQALIARGVSLALEV
jgi:hypothetical protein